MNWHSQKSLVERLGKEDIEQVLMDDRQRDHSTGKPKPEQARNTKPEHKLKPENN